MTVVGEKERVSEIIGVLCSLERYQNITSSWEYLVVIYNISDLDV